MKGIKYKGVVLSYHMCFRCCFSDIYDFCFFHIVSKRDQAIS